MRQNWKSELTAVSLLSGGCGLDFTLVPAHFQGLYAFGCRNVRDALQNKMGAAEYERLLPGLSFTRFITRTFKEMHL